MDGLVIENAFKPSLGSESQEFAMSSSPSFWANKVQIQEAINSVYFKSAGIPICTHFSGLGFGFPMAQT